MDASMQAAAAATATMEPRWATPALDVLDEMAYGVVVATAAGDMVHANAAARHELARHDVLGLRQGRLAAAVAAEAKALQDALARAVDGKRSLLTLAAEGDRRVTLAVVPVGRGGPHVALLFARASLCEALMLCFFARSHALTATEETVLALLCQGHSAPEVARQLKVAVSTVRSHVRSLCAKTRSSGVRELVNRVAVLPPVAPALFCEPMH